MACSKFEYVKKFEHHDELLLQTYTIVRIDGKGFTKFCERHKFRKPNDIRCIGLMNAAAEFVMNKFQDIFLAYGQSD
jgi:tRNA(His) guanylyltransferase